MVRSRHARSSQPYRLRYAGWLLLLCWVLPGVAAALELAGNTQQYPLGGYLSWLEDKPGRLNLEQVIDADATRRFTVSRQRVPNFGFTRSAYWFKLPLANRTAPSHWILETEYPMLDHVDVYYVRDGKLLKHMANGDLLPFRQREIQHRNISFPVELAPGEAMDVYIRVATQSSLQLPIQLITPSMLLQHDQAEFYVFGLYYGVLLAMLCYNLLIYFSIGDSNYLHYVHYLVGYILFQMSLNGLALEFIWPDWPAWGNVATPFFIGVAFLGAVTFVRHFLQLKQRQPMLDQVGKIIWGLFCIIIVASLVLDYSIVIQAAAILAFTCVCYAFVAGLLAWRNNLKQARYFLLAWSALLLGIMLYVLKTFNVLPTNFVTEYALQAGSVMEVILLSFALAHRIKLTTDENKKVHLEANTLLEARVSQRTHELDEALKKLSEANTKLKALNFTDGLTGVRNRKYFDQKIEREWARAQRGGYNLTVMLFDIDHFKSINDNFGHQAGDFCLREVAVTIQSCLKRPCDVMARYGGEEFIVILPLTDSNGAMKVADGIRHRIQGMGLEYNEKWLPVTASIGVCTIVPQENMHSRELISAADEALYRAKREGRNRVERGDVLSKAA